MNLSKQSKSITILIYRAIRAHIKIVFGLKLLGLLDHIL
jgi:hypothetical protein